MCQCFKCKKEFAETELTWVIIDNSLNNAPEILEIPPSIEMLAGETFELLSVVELWNEGVFYDSDNTLEELSFEINVNPSEIILNWLHKNTLVN